MDIATENEGCPKDFMFDFIVEHVNSVCASIEVDRYLTMNQQVIPYKHYKRMKSALRPYLLKKTKKGAIMFCVELCGENGPIHKIEFC